MRKSHRGIRGVPTLWKRETHFPSGVTVKVFFGTTLVDDIVTIQWDHVEQKAPLYGYGSEKFDGVARGTSIVQGVFGVAFRNRAYVTALAEKATQQGSLTAKRKPALDPVSVATTNFGEALDAARIDDLSLYETISSTYKDMFWAPPQRSSLGTAADHDKGFGRMSRGFDIMVAYGNPEDLSQNFTTKLVSDCHITGSKQQVNPNGEPILEVYSFFGKSMDDGFSSDDFTGLDKDLLPDISRGETPLPSDMLPYVAPLNSYKPEEFGVGDAPEADSGRGRLPDPEALVYPPGESIYLSNNFGRTFLDTAGPYGAILLLISREIADNGWSFDHNQVGFSTSSGLIPATDVKKTDHFILVNIESEIQTDFTIRYKLNRKSDGRYLLDRKTFTIPIRRR